MPFSARPIRSPGRSQRWAETAHRGPDERRRPRLPAHAETSDRTLSRRDFRWPDASLHPNRCSRPQNTQVEITVRPGLEPVSRNDDIGCRHLRTVEATPPQTSASLGSNCQLSGLVVLGGDCLRNDALYRFPAAL
jgi:hypothetical protein